MAGPRAASEEAADDRLETTDKLGKAPHEPGGGKLMVRVPPEVHDIALVAAQAAGIGPDQWAAKVLVVAGRGGRLSGIGAPMDSDSAAVC